MHCGGGPGSFGFLAQNVPGRLETGIPIAASRAGAIGVLNFEGVEDVRAAHQALERLQRFGRGDWGVKLDSASCLSERLLAALPPQAGYVILTAAPADRLRALIEGMGQPARRILLEVTSSQQAAAASALNIDALIAKGHEAGGVVGEETTFVLLQRLLAEFSVPVWAHGGIGVHSAAACYAAGAAGVVLDNQLLLTPESELPAPVKAAIERMEGDETICLGAELGVRFRLYKRPGMAAVEQLQQLEQEAASAHQWREQISRRICWTPPESGVWPLGQDAAFAAPLARRFYNVSGILRGLAESIGEHIEAARQWLPLNRGSALAASHGTAYPILQGPMTRVSDTAGFAAAVSEGGGLPFLALALLRAPQVRKLLAETQQLMGDKPWGVGILGFVPNDLRAEQLEVVREFQPPFAIIAGGRPDQAASLEKTGIATYLHVPAPALLRIFIQDGARRFIFEGRECGGHVGPRTSFVLWESMIDVLLEAIAGGVAASELHVVFAGGIHDARSAAMVAAMAAPLAAQGARIGVLMGTAYLFTREAVATGAIVEGFQKEAIECRDTVLLESGPGHATRCAETPFNETFRQLRRKLLAQNKSTEEIRQTLEDLNLGRLRIASKGITRAQQGDQITYQAVPLEEQLREGMYMIGQVAALRHATCTIAELHAEVSSGSSERLSRLTAPQRRLPVPAPPPPAEVAIVGLGCLLPQAPHVRAFWANVLNKVDAIGEVPRERFDINLYFDSDRKARDKVYSRWGGFLHDVPFDPMRYGIPPAALASIDPLQLLALVAVDQALRDAGYDRRDFPRERTAAIFGLSGGLGDLGIEYAVRSMLPSYIQDTPPEVMERLAEWTEDSFAGLLLNVAAGRVANRFNLGGVNFTVDAACASSLAAVYLAARELSAGTSDMVIVGGVDTAQSPFGFLCFSKAQALSPTGRCRTFDEKADGIAISEGITMMVLKRLEDAERDGDRIYAVIKGVAGSSDGRGRSMTAPRLEGQVLALRRAYQQAGFAPSTVSLIEAHGTGTVAGDEAELEALTKVFGEDGARPQSCAIGSVKSMVGHTKSAAGVTGLMKVALALYHKILPPTLNVERPNPKLRDPRTPFFVNVEPRPWIAPRGAGGEILPRRAGVSSFGFGGTNFHAVVEEYLGDFAEPRERAVTEQWPAEMFLWSAPSAQALAAALSETEGVLEQNPPLHLLAAAVARRAQPADSGLRLAIVAGSPDELRARMASAKSALLAGQEKLEDSKGIYLAPAARPGKIAFLFPGQGSQYPGMLRDLAIYFPEFAEALEDADTVLSGRYARPLSSYIYPPPAFTPEEKYQQMQALTDTVVAQPALGAVEIALARLLERLGVRPDMTAGHSYGEYVALCAGGAFGAQTLFHLSESRGRAIKESVNGNAGTMAAVVADARTVAQALEQVPGITIANYNSPRQTIIAGAEEAVSAAMTQLETAGLTARPIPVACAFHSPLMQPARDRLAGYLTGQQFSTPAISVFSNTLAAAYPAEPAAITRLLVDHLTQPVRFMDQIRSMYDSGARLFVEVGPKGVLSGLTRQILEGRQARILQTDVSERHGVVQLLHVLAQLAVSGVAIDMDQLFRGRVPQPVQLAQLTAQPAEPAWLVNGGRAFARAQRPQPVAPVKVAPAAPVSPMPAPAPVAVPPPVMREMPPPPLPSPAPAADAVMLQFQQLMSQFLQTQAAVMTAYLQGAPTAMTTAMTTISPVVTPLPLADGRGFETPAAPVLPTPPAPVAHPDQPASPSPGGGDVRPAPARRDARAELLKIVSERTGYPVEMLELNAGIEADLGIDSIKRVEILSAFQRLCSASEQAAIQGLMEQLTRARTLGEVVEKLHGVFQPQPPPPAQPAAAEPCRDIAAELLKIISERTGYPVEMLELNAGIEADLGIDSIKRVEILSAFQRLCSASEQAAIQGVMEKLTRVRSLGDMVKQLAAVLEPHPAPSVPRLRLVAVEKPRQAAPPKHYPGRVVLITDDETGVAAGLAEQWNRAGEKVLLLRHSTDTTIAADGVFSTDLRNPQAIEAVVASIRGQHGPIGAVIHLLPLRSTPPTLECTLSEWRDQVQLDVKSLYALARATQSDLQQRGQAQGALFAAVTARGGDFGLQAPAAIPLTHHAVADFIKTLALEFTNIRSKVVDLDATDPEPILRQKLMDELSSPDDTLQVGLPGDRRLTVAPQWAALPEKILRPVDRDWVFLLTGGARGITAEIAKLLAARFQPKLILAGMSSLAEEEPPETAGLTEPAPLKAALMARMRAQGLALRPAEVEAAYHRLLRHREIRRTLEDLRQKGARVEYHAVDVRDETAIGHLIDHIYREHGRLDVVIHGAGVIEDKFIRDKTPESFDRVVHTKADSAFLLSRKLRRETLRAFIFMSSITAAFGNRGQADYAAANGIMNALATALDARWPGRVVAMNWGPWDQAGMASGDVQQQFRARGIQLIPVEGGAEALLREIQCGEAGDPVVVLGDGPWTKAAVAPEAPRVPPRRKVMGIAL